MGDYNQKRNKKLTRKVPAEEKQKLAEVDPSPSRSQFTKPTPPNSVYFLLGNFGCIKIRGHQCLCHMDPNIRKQVDVFFKKAQQTSCDPDTFLYH